MLPEPLTFQFDEKVFLKDYWQRAPLLIRNALPDWRSPLTPEDLAGLALEEDADSRLIGLANGAWQLSEGPFTGSEFDRPDVWTLLVNAVDQWVPAVSELRQCLRFLPNWRFDDVMVSYAVEGGGVGPHFDRYDVFLLQGSGSRLWRLGNWCDEDTPRIDHGGLNLLEQFETTEEHVLNPGDVLYVPPGMAHWGVAQTDCLTYSLGFRAPRITELMARWVDTVLERINPDLLLEDKASVCGPARAGEITGAHLENARQAILNTLLSLDDGAWLGQVVTESGEHAEPLSPLARRVRLQEGARLAWDSVGSDCRVFANGEQHLTGTALQPFLEQLCGNEIVDYPALCAADAELCSFLISNGVLRGV